jgi:hypothetical protein
MHIVLYEQGILTRTILYPNQVMMSNNKACKRRTRWDETI